MNVSIGRPWYRQFWPWLLIALPGSAVIAGLFTLWIATLHHDARVHDSYYKDGLAIKRDRALDETATRMNLSFDLKIDPAKRSLSGTLHGHLPKYPDTLSVRFLHPQRADKDFVLELTHNGLGRYVAHLESIPFNRWYLELTTTETASEPWRLRGSLDGTKSDQLSTRLHHP